MRVLVILVEPAPYVLRLSRELQKAPFQVDIVFLERSVSQPWSVDISGAEHVLDGGRLKRIGALFRLISKNRPAVVHVAGWGRIEILFAIVISRLFRARVVAISDTWIIRRRFIFSLLRKLVFRTVDVFCAAGSPQKRFLLQAGVPEFRVHAVGMSVDVRRMQATFASHGAALRDGFRTRYEIARSATVYLFVGRLVKDKGVDLLLRAFADLSSAEPAVLVLVGDGAERKRLAMLSSTVRRVIFCGRLSGRDLLGAYAAADVFVLPSLYEPWGLVVNEAMAAGLPVISSDSVGSVSDLVIEGTTGIIFRSGDENSLLSAMQRMAADKTLRRNFGCSAQLHIAAWSIERQAERIVAAWEHARSLS